ncbi:hypothetical protein D3C86_2007550 [compost metagenome]
MKQDYIDLERRVSDQAQQLRFGRFLGWHQIQDGDPQRTDILVKSLAFIHYKDIFSG